MEEKIDLTNFERSLEELAEKLEMPIPKENMEARKAAILAFVNFMITL